MRYSRFILFRKFTLSLAILFILNACSFSSDTQPFTVNHWIGPVTTQGVQQWRLDHQLPLDATIGFFQDGRYVNLGIERRLRVVHRSISPYENDIPCYLNMQGSYRGESIDIQAPCKRQEFRRRYRY